MVKRVIVFDRRRGALTRRSTGRREAADGATRRVWVAGAG